MITNQYLATLAIDETFTEKLSSVVADAISDIQNRGIIEDSSIVIKTWTHQDAPIATILLSVEKGQVL